MNCLFCKKALTKVQISYKGKFCSHNCSCEQIKLKRAKCTCRNCESVFYIRKSVKERGQAMFCSTSCKLTWQKENREWPYSVDFIKNDEELLYYLTGFFTADGHLGVNKRAYTLSTDKQIIEDLTKRLKLTSKIGIYNSNKITTKGTLYKTEYSFGLSGPYVDFLISRGFEFGPKTGKEPFPPNMNKENFRHFLRGFIDGDGCFFLSNNKAKLSLVCASHHFLKNIKNEISKYVDVLGGTLRPVKNIYSLEYGFTDTKEIGKFIYEKNTICLHRKFNVYKKGIEKNIKQIKKSNKKKAQIIYEFNLYLSDGMSVTKAANLTNIPAYLVHRWERKNNVRSYNAIL
jgi:hypothetical protein